MLFIIRMRKFFGLKVVMGGWGWDGDIINWFVGVLMMF